MKISAGTFFFLAIAMSALIGETQAAPPPAQTVPGCGPVVECIQKMMDLSNQLTQDNQALAKKVSALEHDLATANEAIKHLRERKTMLLNRGGDREFAQGMFWPGSSPSHVNYTCPDRNVLVGMDFEMSSDGVARHPSGIRFICRELSP